MKIKLIFILTGMLIISSGCGKKNAEQREPVLSAEDTAYVELAELTEAEFNANNHSNILAHAEQLIELNPYKADGYFWRGVVATLESRFNEAQTDFEKTLMLQPDYPMVKDWLAWAIDVRPFTNPQR